MTELETLFNQQKAELEQLSKPFEEMKAEKERTEKTLIAFKNELQEMQDKAKSDLSVSGKISEEEYLNLRNGTTGLKARIEYHEAKLEELELALQKEAADLKNKVRDILNTRAKIFKNFADEKLKNWLNENKAELAEIFSFIYFSDRFQPITERHPVLDPISEEDQIRRFIGQEVSKFIVDNYQIDDKYKFKNPLIGFAMKRPTQLHYESFKPQGFSKLLDNVKNTKE